IAVSIYRQRSILTKLMTSHPEHAEPRLVDRRVETGRQAEGQNAARLLRCDDAIIPQARRRVVGVTLALELLEDGRFELRLLLDAPRLPFGLDIVPPHRRQHGRG